MIRPIPSTRRQLERSTPSPALARLRNFVLAHRSGGGCRMLSEGSGCSCPLCDLDALAEQAGVRVVDQAAKG